MLINKIIVIVKANVSIFDLISNGVPTNDDAII